MLKMNFVRMKIFIDSYVRDAIAMSSVHYCGLTAPNYPTTADASILSCWGGGPRVVLFDEVHTTILVMPREGTNTLGDSDKEECPHNVLGCAHRKWIFQMFWMKRSRLWLSSIVSASHYSVVLGYDAVWISVRDGQSVSCKVAADSSITWRWWAVAAWSFQFHCQVV